MNNENKKYRISFGDLVIGNTAKKNIQKIIDTNWVSEGELVKEFEEKFADKFGYKHAIMTSSGTDAVMCACASLYDFNANREDEIIVPALSFVATSNAVLAAGFIPKFVDIELETLNINPDLIENAITDKTIAILPVHTMGKPCNMEKINDIANRNDLTVIEDCCEAHGAQYKHKIGETEVWSNVGTVGNASNMGAFSFYTAHQVVCGEGGTVVTNDNKTADIIRSVKSHGRPPNSIKFDFQRVGYNSKTTEFASALGIEGLEQFDENFKIRKDNLYNLLKLTKDSGLEKYCYFLKEDKNKEIVSPHAFPIVIKDKYQTINTDSGIQNTRDILYQYLELNGIQCKTLFGSLPTQHRCFEFLNYKLGQFPVAEYVGRNGLHFGCHQYLHEEDLEYINEKLRMFFNNFK